MCDEKTDVLTLYQNISNKLRKKRILKKPNVAEASQQFENLGKICEREELQQYAGLSYQAAAKCQNSLGNHLDEGFLLLKSSKQFLSCYLKQLQNESVLNESYLSFSYTLYKECLERLQNNKEHNKLVNDMITGGVMLQMGKDLREKVNVIETSYQEFEEALQFYFKSPVEKINCLQNLVSSYNELGSYNESLKLVDEIIKEGELLPAGGLKNDTLRNAEITRTFLLLILQPTPQQISPAAASALEKYAWVETSYSSEVKDLATTLNNEGLSMLSENLFLKLQSLVMACQYCDEEILTCLESDLIPYLSVEQRMLLKVLIDQYKN